MSQAREVVSPSVKSELPDINIAVTALASELFALTVGLYLGVKTVWKNALWLVICPWCFGEIRYLSSLQVNPHHRRRIMRLVAGEGHFFVVVVEILCLQHAVAISALKDRLSINQLGRA